MLADDAGGRGADGLGGQDVLLLLDGEDLAAHLPGHGDPVEKAEHDEDGNHARAEPCHQRPLRACDPVLDGDREQNHDQNVRQGVDDIDNAHHHHVHHPAEIAGDGAVDDADDNDDQRREDADQQRNARAVDDADGVVAAQGVGAHDVGEDLAALVDFGLLLRAVLEGGEVLGRDILLGVGIGIEVRDDEGDEGNDHNDDQGDHGDVVLAQAAQGVLREGHGLAHRHLLGLLLVPGLFEELRIDLQAEGIFECFFLCI